MKDLKNGKRGKHKNIISKRIILKIYFNVRLFGWQRTCELF